MGPAIRLYRLCMLALPAGFRALHGEPLETTYRDRLGRVGDSRLRFVYTALAECADVVWTGLAERRRTISLGADVRQAARQLRRHPGVSLTVVATVGIGLGAAASMFAVVDAVLVRDLAHPEPDRLVRLWQRSGAEGTASSTRRLFSLPDLEDWAAASDVTAAMGVFTTRPADLVVMEDGFATEVETAFVSTGFFEALATRPAHGTLPSAEEVAADPHRVILSHAFWIRRFGADSEAVGRTLDLNDRGYLVQAVMPPSFSLPDDQVEIWTFLETIPSSSIPLRERSTRVLEAVARLAPDVSVGLATERLDEVARSASERDPVPDDPIAGAEVQPLLESVVGDVAPALVALSLAVGGILLLVCANVANLLLARGQERAKELAVRTALGVSRVRVARQLVVEALLLALAGAAVGVALMWVAREAAADVLTALLPRGGTVEPDVRVIAFTVGAALMATVAFGVLPALRSSSTAHVLRAARAPRVGRRTLIATQTALALVLTVAAGTALDRLNRLLATDAGFDPTGVLAVEMTASAARYPASDAYVAFQRTIEERLRGLPGVVAVASLRHTPYRGAGEAVPYHGLDDLPTSAESVRRADLIQFTPGAFDILDVEVHRGRAPTSTVGNSAPIPVVVNRTLADGKWPGADPVGRRLDVYGGLLTEVVAVVGDVRHAGPSTPARPTVYIPQDAFARRGWTVLVRTQDDPADLVVAVRAIVAAVDPGQPLTRIEPLADVVRDGHARTRMVTGLLSVAGALALLLASTGVYAVAARTVTARVREIGIRMALGAGPRSTLASVLASEMVPVLAGVGAGLAVVAALGLVLATRLPDIGPVPPRTYVAALAAVGVSALLAIVVPAARAARVSPGSSLRAD